MNHGNKLYKLNRRRGHREALLLNLFKSLVNCKRIKTTITKAKALRPYAEKLVTKAKRAGMKPGTVNNLPVYRKILSDLHQDEIVAKELFNVVVPKLAQRPGGYLNIVRCGMRPDGTQMALIGFVDHQTL